MLKLHNLTIHRGAHTVGPISLSIQKHESWVIRGPQGSGKSSLLECLGGHLAYRGTYTRTATIGFLGSLNPRAEETYFSERYHAHRKSRKVRDIVVSGLITELLDLDELDLSNGQAKRVSIAKLLSKNPEIIVLDEPFNGLDPETRKRITREIEGLTSVIALRATDEVPATHEVELSPSGSVQFQGTYRPQSRTIQIQKKRSSGKTGGEIVRLEGINVVYFDKPVLQDISWTIREGEKWCLKGENGSGKTTLLAMITGDHPKVYNNKVTIFGNRRGAGVSLAQVQAKIGHSSPEIHRHYPKYLTTTHCLASAFGESFTPVVLNTDQQELVDSIVTHFGVEEWLDIEMREVSPAIQRLFLLLRALVKRPPLIILDEPFAGFDEPMIQKARTYIDSLDSAIIFVTHFEEEVPESIDRVLRLQKGKVIESS